MPLTNTTNQDRSWSVILSAAKNLLPPWDSSLRSEWQCRFWSLKVIVMLLQAARKYAPRVN